MTKSRCGALAACLTLRKRLTSGICLLLALCALQLLNGCTTGPSYSAMKSSIQPLDPRLGRIYFYRTYNFVGGALRPEMSLNGMPIGKSVNGGFFFTDCAPGSYEFLLHSIAGPIPIGPPTPEFKLSFKLAAGQTIYIRYIPVELPHCELVDPSIGAAKVQGLTYDGAVEDPAKSAKEALEIVAQEEKKRTLTAEETKRALAQFTGQDADAREIFKLQPSSQFSVTQATELLITWKNEHLNALLQRTKTEELRSYVNQIEHTILQATDASEKEKDEAQQLLAGGATNETKHTELARAYRLRIEVLKPILAAIKEEVANRSK